MKLRCKEEKDKSDYGIYGRIILSSEMLMLQICIMKNLCLLDKDSLLQRRYCPYCWID